MHDIVITTLSSTSEPDIYPLVQEISPELSHEEFLSYLCDMKSHGYTVIAAHHKKELVGVSGVWIGTKFYCGKYLELDNFVVDEAYRGKGIGSMLIDYATTMAKEHDCKSVVLNATVTNTEAHKLYDKHDFIRFGHHRLLWL